MEEFAIYNQEIYSSISDTLKNQFLQSDENSHDYAIFSSKYVSERLRDLIHINDLREAGSFFTGDELARNAINDESGIDDKSVIFDPACGAGNLLLAASKHFRVHESLSTTLTHWGKKLWGLDLHKEFVESTKLRIIGEAVSRGVFVDEKDLSKLLILLPNIKYGDIFDQPQMLSNVDYLVINPPFGLVEKKDWCKWTNGKVNAASLFLEFCIKNLREKSNIIAILPDVLRSGSRYYKWRSLISSNVIFNCNNNGVFDNKTDINTFILKGVITKNNHQQEWYKSNISKQTLSQISNINVGPVVPYRDKYEGVRHKYIHTRNIEPWKIVDIDKHSDTRLYKGRFTKPPFIVVRRNSRPDEKFRAKASIITGNQSVAVENHFIIIEPFVKTVIECEKIVKILKSDETNLYLNNRIRCRHLTVTAVKDIPIE